MNQSLDAAATRLDRWLIESALPRWSSTGRYADTGAFVEKIAMDGTVPVSSRRVRVSARQAYVFAEAGRLGWSGPWKELVAGALAFLAKHGRRDDGGLKAMMDADGRVTDDGPDLYDQAFYLFALAHAFGTLGDTVYRDDAVRLMSLLDGRMANPAGGYEEALTRKLPLRSNPHMHLLEAALAWLSVDQGAQWRRLGGGIVSLCRQNFIDRQRGLLLEEFDGDWQPLHADEARPTEPGHNFEWAWLLYRWRAVTGESTIDLAEGLLGFAERHGVDSHRGVAFNSLRADGVAIDATARLWPQTERLKANLAAAEHAKSSGGDSAPAVERAGLAAAALLRYLETPVAGLWRDRMLVDGSLVDEPAPASTFYHIICAISELRRVRAILG